ncbi:glycerol-3-phosphate acyltransferase [Actinomycetes bacterium NPDC127524]
MLIIIVLIILSYLFGSINGAYYVTKLASGSDIRQLGSGNAGARNAGRQLGKSVFLAALLIDAGKTLAMLNIASSVSHNRPFINILCAAFLLLGHIWPAHLRFHGGKGVAVLLASVLFLVPAAIPVIGVLMAVCTLLMKKFTVPGLVCLLSIPVTSYITGKPEAYTIGLLILTVFVIAAHILKLHQITPATT